MKPGEVLGLLGRTGSGKSTMARLLLRFYDPQAGTIALGGTDIRDCTLAELRKHVALVTQNIEIMQGTIRDNLTFMITPLRIKKLSMCLLNLDSVHGMSQCLKGWIRCWPQEGQFIGG